MESAAPRPTTRQWQIAAALFVCVVAILAFGYYWFLAADYLVLARSVRPEQAAAIVDELKKESVSYQLQDGGTTILVPAKEVDAARLEISSGDLPLKGTVGFELFNQSDMGLTDFAQKVNYQRALQGEIARTIMAMDGIAFARVHIALPERSLFRSASSEPRAAVTLMPQPGVQIDAQRIAGIQRLVAATVPDLALDQVAILNERGQLLTPEFSDVPNAASSGNALESNYSERISRVIAEIAPRAHVEAKVTLVPTGGTSGSPAVGSVPAYGKRNQAIRVVLFEGSVLTVPEEQAIRAAVAADLNLQAANGDQLSFSPAPQIAAGTPTEVSAPPALAAKGPLSREAEQDRFMAELARGWTVALSLFGIAALLVTAFVLRNQRLQRRHALVRRIRQHLLPIDGAADVA